ncbi:MAG: GMC oxidoreductase [Pseudomonadota bacterium]|nr:GMC oxidoreductase [Pseudomonadota bacterium]
MNRRDHLKTLGALSAALPFAAQGGLLSRDYSLLVPEVYAPVPRPPAYTQALVIGSGFGGSVSALRLAQANIDVTVLERGFQWPRDPWRDIFTNDTLPDGRGFWFRTRSKSVIDLPSTPVDAFGGVMDVTEYDHIDVWRGACVGGGSMVFTGAMPQPPRPCFDAIFGGTVDYAEMDAVFYPRVRRMLRLSPMPADIYASAPFGHSRRWDRSARQAGYAPAPVQGIWNWDVVRSELNGGSRPSCIIGRSNLGNSNGAKFDLNQNYLLQARATGKATVYPAHEVKSIAFDGSRFVVDTVKRHPHGAILDRYTLTSDYLFLAAGSIGTSELLVRARAQGALPQLNEHIGQGWGGNGDSTVARSGAYSDGVTLGAACASMIHDDVGGMPVTLENWYAPGVPLNVATDASLGMALDLTRRGRFEYDPATDRVRLDWPATGNDAVIAATRALNNRIAAANGQIPGVPPIVADVGAGFTAHPLGGAVLDRATDNHGGVIGYPRLRVMDGALIPGSTGTVNPSFTIAAMAERNIAHFIASGP